MNYMFQPTEDRDHEKVLQQLEEGSVDPASLSNTAMRTLILHQRMASARAKAVELFTGKEMVACVIAIRREVKKGRFALRPDQDVFANLALREKMLNLLLSYSTPWLRVGLETLYGEHIVPGTPNQLSPTKAAQTPRIKRRKGKVSKPWKG